MTDSSQLHLFDSLSDGILLLDSSHTIVWKNKAVVSFLTGLSIDGSDDLQLCVTSIFGKSKLELHKSISTEIVKKDPRTEVEIIHTGFTLDQEIILLIKLGQREKFFHESLIQNQRLKSLVSSLNTALLLEDENRNIVLTNKLFCTLFEIPVDPNDLVGVNCADSAEQSKHFLKIPKNLCTPSRPYLINEY